MKIRIGNSLSVNISCYVKFRDIFFQESLNGEIIKIS